MAEKHPSESTPERKRKMEDDEASSSKITKKIDEVQSEEATSEMMSKDLDEPLEKGEEANLGKSSKNDDVKKDRTLEKLREDYLDSFGIQHRGRWAESMLESAKRYGVYTKLSEGYGFDSSRQLYQNPRVYAGWQENVVGAAREVDIKLINDSKENRNEVSQHLQLDLHPNVISMFHFGIYTPDIGSYIYMAMEKCGCRENLKDYMVELRMFQLQLNDDHKLAMAKQFLLGLKFIHSNGIINGNIKLENVSISTNGNYLKICNFGFNKSLHLDSSNANQSRESMNIGGNGAPETYSKYEFSEKADVFAGGLLVHSIVSDGRHAFGDDPDHWISNIRDNTNRDLSNITLTEKEEMEPLLSDMLEFEPKDRPTVKVALETNILRKATTDLYLPYYAWELAELRSLKKERLKDVFQDEIIPAFAKMEAFREFARSKRGLCLDEDDLQVIAENYADSAKTQKLYILRKWQEKTGPEATVQKIRSILAEYQKPKPEHERLTDSFQDEVIGSFASITDFLKFARSKRGLQLEESDIQHIREDHASSAEEQKMQLLEKWKMLNGAQATVPKIRSLVESFCNYLRDAQNTEHERLIDVFQEEVITFASTTDFLKFARSKRGLRLKECDIQNIREDHASSVEEQKMQLLEKWKMLNGDQATVPKIRSLVESFRNYLRDSQNTEREATDEITQSPSERQSQDQEAEELKCVFEEVTKPYTAMEELKGFAKSKSGLGLTDNEFQDITSFGGQKMQMLKLWREKLGSHATVQNLRSSAESYAAEKEFIHLPNGSFGMYKEKVLRDQCYVYLGAQKSGSDDQQCAVKLLRNRKDRAEAEMLVKLEQHENVVKVLHVGEYRGGLSLTTFVVMELCTTQHLGDTIRARVFEEITAQSWAKQIVRALVFIHKNNIVHLDIKPQNILFTQDQKYIKLADFDSSKKIQDESGLVENPSDVGTEGYRAPEMYNDKQITQKVDIFAAGVTLAEVLSHGYHPFGTDRYAWTSNVKNNKGLDLSHLRVANKDTATKLLMRMLDPEHEKRPSAPEVLDDAVFQK